MKKKTIALAIVAILIGSMFVFIIMAPEEESGISYGPDQRNKLDVYLPNGGNVTEDVPALFYIHGGGWSSGSKADGKGYADGLNENGYAVVSINYRYISEAVKCSDILDDIDLAMNFIKEHGSEYHVRTDKIAIGGDSAGAHLAMLYAYSRTSPITIAFVMANVGPVDFTDPGYFLNVNAASGTDVFFRDVINKLAGTDFTIDEFKAGVSDQRIRDISPINFINGDSPPTVFKYGKLDELVPYSNAQEIEQKLSELGSEGYDHGFFLLEHSGHGNLDERDQTKSDAYYAKLFVFFNTYLLV